VPVADVRKILKDEVERCRDGEHMREVWALADRRLAAVELKFYNTALEGDGDPQSAIVFVKTNETRRNIREGPAFIRLPHRLEAETNPES
jgi:hypothetical protein